MRRIVYWVVCGVILVALMCGVALALVPPSVALASSAASTHYTLAVDPHLSTLPDLVRGLTAHLPRAVLAPSRWPSTYARHLATLHRSVCLVGCPPIVLPFSPAR